MLRIRMVFMSLVFMSILISLFICSQLSYASDPLLGYAGRHADVNSSVSDSGGDVTQKITKLNPAVAGAEVPEPSADDLKAGNAKLPVLPPDFPVTLIKKYRQKALNMEKALQEEMPPSPRIKKIVLNKGKVWFVHLRLNYTTTFIFPFPVDVKKDVSLGNRSLFSVQGKANSGAVLVTPRKPFKSTNMTVFGPDGYPYQFVLIENRDAGTADFTILARAPYEGSGSECLLAAALSGEKPAPGSRCYQFFEKRAAVWGRCATASRGINFCRRIALHNPDEVVYTLGSVDFVPVAGTQINWIYTDETKSEGKTVFSVYPVHGQKILIERRNDGKVFKLD